MTRQSPAAKNRKQPQSRTSYASKEEAIKAKLDAANKLLAKADFPTLQQEPARD